MPPARRPDHPKPNPSPLALRIRHARAQSGASTDAAFAESCGFDGRAYWRYTTENVKPSAEALAAIARTGNVDLGWLINGDDPATPKSPEAA